jgi:hypothetical protein
MTWQTHEREKIVMTGRIHKRVTLQQTPCTVTGLQKTDIRTPNYVSKTSLAKQDSTLTVLLP